MELVDPVDELGEDRRDHGTRRLPGTVGVERPHDRHRKVECVVVAQRHHVGPDLRSRVWRLGLQGMGLVDGDVAGGPVDLARRRVHQPVDTVDPAGVEHVLGAADVGLDIALGCLVGVWDADEGGQVEHHFPAFHRPAYP